MHACANDSAACVRAAAAAGLLRCLTGAGGGAEAAVLRRLHLTDARPLRAAHPRAAAAAAAHDWGWEPWDCSPPWHREGG